MALRSAPLKESQLGRAPPCLNTSQGSEVQWVSGKLESSVPESQRFPIPGTENWGLDALICRKAAVGSQHVRPRGQQKPVLMLTTEFFRASPKELEEEVVAVFFTSVTYNLNRIRHLASSPQPGVSKEPQAVLIAGPKGASPTFLCDLYPTWGPGKLFSFLTQQAHGNWPVHRGIQAHHQGIKKPVKFRDAWVGETLRREARERIETASRLQKEPAATGSH